MDKEHRPTGKRERVNPSGAEGGSRYLRRDAQGRFTENQTKVGCSVTADKQHQAKHTAPKGMKDKGD